MKQPRLWYVSYDIAHAKRLRKTAKTLEQYGERVQKSLFLCAMSAEQTHSLTQKLQQIYDPTEDRMMLRPVCRTCRQATKTQGMGGYPERQQPFWII
jgi:CRISPR-associated protein Cas2